MSSRLLSSLCFLVMFVILVSAKDPSSEAFNRVKFGGDNMGSVPFHLTSFMQDWDEQQKDWTGWSTEYDPSLDTTECDFKVIDANRVSRSEFESLYMNKEPVIILNLEDNQAFRYFTAKAHFLSVLDATIGHQGPDINVAFVHQPIFSQAPSVIPLRQYLAHRVFRPQAVDTPINESFYMFGEHYQWGDVWEEMLELYKWPLKYHFPRHHGKGKRLHFGMGGTGTGVPFHRHDQVLAELFHGKKHWFFYPPTEPGVLPPGFNYLQSSLQWLTEVYPTLSSDEKKGLRRCVMKPGMVMYVPREWWHSTLNLGESVFGTIYNI